MIIPTLMAVDFSIRLGKIVTRDAVNTARAKKGKGKAE